MDAADQLDQAVSLALQGSDSGLKAQALEFIAQVQADPGAWLTPSLDIVLSQGRSDQTQFFSLQIIEKVISGSQDVQTLNMVRSKLWTMAQSLENAPNHIRNKLADAVTELFMRLYPEEWPTFFSDLLQLVAENRRNAGEFYFNVLLAVHDKIGDQLFARDSEEMQRTNWLKDMIRDRDAVRLAQSWVEILNGDSGNTIVIDGILRVIKGWVVWTDVSLILPTVPLVEKQLGNPETRNSAVLALVEILGKKMGPEFKLELLQTTNVVQALKSCDRNSVDFRELLAKLVNAILFEASHALNTLPLGDASPVTVGLEAVIADAFPQIIEFLGDDYDDTSVQLVPGLTEYLTYLRREARGTDKKISIGGNLNASRTQNLRLILDTLVAKSRYDPDDYELGEIDAEDEEAEFDEFRARIRVLQEQLAQIDTRLFLDVTGGYISQILTANSPNADPSASAAAAAAAAAAGAPAGEIAGTPTSDWTALELVLYELSVYNEVARQWTSKASKFGNDLAAEVAEVQQTQFMLFAQMVGAGGGSANWSHPANRMWFMELVHRQAPQFLTDKNGGENRNLLTDALQFFLKHGIQSSEIKVRVRSWYLFYRLIRAVRRSSILMDPSLGPLVFQAVAPYLPVHISVPNNNNKSTSNEELSIAAIQDTIFSSQLYLYELCGILCAVSEDKAGSSELMRQLLATMFADIDAATMASSPGPEEYLRVHHNIVALSSLTKGLAETSTEKTVGSLDALVSQLQTATQMVVAVLERLHSIQIVREACRQSFSRMLGFLGDKIIMEISSFINVVLQTSTPVDLGDFLSFLGQLTHQFEKNSQIFEMFTSLCTPLFEKIFSILQQVAQTADVEAEGSTDAQLFRRDVVASYLQFLYNLLNNNYAAILFAENNGPIFDSVFSSLMHYSANGDVKGGAGSAANQKMAVVILTKMVSLWGSTGKVDDAQFGAALTVPIFSEGPTYERLTEMCWTLPANDAISFTDAQSRMVISELAGLQQAMLLTRGVDYRTYVVQYLNSAGLDAGAIEEFGLKLNLPPKDFKRFFVQFLQKALAK